MENAKTLAEIKIPEGTFCGGNCATCYYAGKRDDDGRRHCGYYDHWYFPSDRQGCLSYKSA